MSSFIPTIRRRQGPNAPDGRLYDEIQSALGQFANGIADGVLSTITIPAANAQASQQFAWNHGLGRKPQGFLVVYIEQRAVLTVYPTQPSGMDATKQLYLNATCLSTDTFGAKETTALAWVF